MRLVPVEDEAFAGFLEGVTAPYAAERATADHLPIEEAEAEARRQIAQLLPQGRRTPGHFFFWIVAQDGESPSGHVWYRLDAVRGEAFVCHIAVRPERRRRGLASAALRLVETDARTAGCRRIALNVFAPNAAAIALYAKLGYAVVSQHMNKRL